MNKLFIIISLLFLVGCGTSKKAIKTNKKQNGVVKTVPKKKEAIPVKKEEVTVKPILTDVVKEQKTEILEATSRIKVTTEMVLVYINTFKEVAKANMQRDGIPASITLAQGILESGAGTGSLSVRANNHFGIKCHKEWTGPSVKHDDDELQECFRKYEKAEESYKDHSFFLTSRPWYKSLFQLPKDDYKAWAKGLKKAGYATDVKYPEKLIGLIERYELQQYDAEVLGTEFVSVKKEQIEAQIKKETQLVDTEKEYQVSQGDTLYSISKKFSLTVAVLKSLNNITDNSLSIGQVLKIK